jgi:hypothetical protein
MYQLCSFYLHHLVADETPQDKTILTARERTHLYEAVLLDTLWTRAPARCLFNFRWNITLQVQAFVQAHQ